MAKITPTKYTHRFLARFIIETATPLAVGSGEKDTLTDSLVAIDINGLPYIPATAIAGVLRRMVGEEYDTLFGFQNKDTGRGSEVIFTEAKILSQDGKVIDGLNLSAIHDDDLLKHYQELPIRQHVRISNKGVAEATGKFDEQVVYAGTRFCFEIEMVSDGKNDDRFVAILQQLYNKNLRIGGGTRCGFGEIKVVELQIMTLNLKNNSDLSLYLEKPSALNSDFWQKYADRLNLEMADLISNTGNIVQSGDTITYTLSITPEAFFLFGAGTGDDEADMIPAKGKKVVWEYDNDSKLIGRLIDNLLLIPATSVKGALAHRVAFHWNRLNGIFADDVSGNNSVGRHNIAVKVLFGSEGDSDDKDMTRGNLMLSDLIKDMTLPDKLFNHVFIDNFTGGTVDGALFSEKVTYGDGKNFTMTLSVDCKGLRKACCDNADADLSADDIYIKVLEALKCTLQNICDGLLPLGGGVNRGHGVFSGSFTEEKTAQNEIC